MFRMNSAMINAARMANHHRDLSPASKSRSGGGVAGIIVGTEVGVAKSAGVDVGIGAVVGDGSGVGVGVGDGSGVGVEVGDGSGVGVAVAVAVGVGAGVGVGVGIGVGEGSGVGVGVGWTWTESFKTIFAGVTSRFATLLVPATTMVSSPSTTPSSTGEMVSLAEWLLRFAGMVMARAPVEV